MPKDTSEKRGCQERAGSADRGGGAPALANPFRAAELRIMRFLLVEDDVNLSCSIARGLREHAYVVDVAAVSKRVGVVQ